MWLGRRDLIKLGLAGVGGLGLAGATVLGARARIDLAVGGKDFPEQWILAELFARVAAAHTGARAGRLTLGGSLLCHQALLHGDIQAYVEYTGTALMAILQRDAVSDPRQAYRLVKDAYRDQFGLRWLSPLGFENTWAVLVRPDLAQREGLRTISQLARASDRLRGAVPFEFYDRPDGFRGMMDTYQMHVGRGVQQMSLGNIYRSVARGQVDYGVGNSTDGLIDRLGLVMLDDDRRFFPPYEPALVIREDIAARHPALIAAFERFAGRISTERMRRANYEVDNAKRHPGPVAEELLRALGALS
jgi:osmoprotectant transport system substrate-binding protein